MFLLKKVFQLRDHANEGEEKPFLEHLEDLRLMIVRVAITLALSTLLCFVFQEQLMEILRRPVERVWMAQLQEKLPQKEGTAPRLLDVDTWEKAKEIEHAVAALEPAQREAMYQALGNENLVFHSKAVGLLRAALVLPEERRQAFLQGLEIEPELQRQVKVLLATAPSPEIDHRGNLRLMSALKPTETFMLSMKLSFFAGIVLAFPFLLMFILQFILPGLHKQEKRVLWPSLAIGFGLFLAGVFFAYFAVLPRALNFFYEWSGRLGVSNDWRIGEYITFATQFTLLFGLSFELPVVVMVLVKLGLLDYAMMSKTRNYAIVAIFVTAAIITPTPDILTLNLMALPMVLLYEICIWLAWLDARRARKREEEETRERMERLLTGQEGESEVGEGDVPESGDDGWDEETPTGDGPVDVDDLPRLPELDDLDPPPSHDNPEEEERRRSER